MTISSTIRHSVYTNIHTILFFLLILTIGSIFSTTYLSVSRTLTLPQRQFAAPFVGRDLTAYTVAPVYDMRQGKTPFIFGYGSVVIADITIHILQSVHVCSPENASTCDYVLYVALCVSSVLGFSLLLMLVRKEAWMVSALLYFAFLLGVPYAKSLEAGNLDSILSVLYGAVTYILLKGAGKKQSVFTSVCTGVLLGLLLSTKAFFIVFVLYALFISRRNRVLLAAFAISYVASSLWPWVYGVKSGLLDVFTFALRGSDAFGPQLYTQINYGNNAIISYVSNLLAIIDTGKVSLPTHTFFTQLLTVIVAGILFIKPLMDEHTFQVIAFLKQKKQLYQHFWIPSAPCMLMIVTYATVCMITLPAWSYDYRLLYIVPILFMLLDRSSEKRTKELLYWSIILFLLKGLWIPKDRLMNIFLYAHLYMLLRASISHWKNSIQLR